MELGNNQSNSREATMYKQPSTTHMSTQAPSGDKFDAPDRTSAFRSAFDFQKTGAVTFQSAFDFVNRAAPSGFRSAFDWVNDNTRVVSAFDFPEANFASSAFESIEHGSAVKSAFDFE